MRASARGDILAWAVGVVNERKTAFPADWDGFCSDERKRGLRKDKFVHLCLTFRYGVSKIYAVWCTLAGDGLRWQRFIDNRRNAGAKRLSRPKSDVFIA